MQSKYSAFLQTTNLFLTKEIFNHFADLFSYFNFFPPLWNWNKCVFQCMSSLILHTKSHFLLSKLSSNNGSLPEYLLAQNIERIWRKTFQIIDLIGNSHFLSICWYEHIIVVVWRKDLTKFLCKWFINWLSAGPRVFWSMKERLYKLSSKYFSYWAS